MATYSVCPGMVRTSRPLATSQIVTLCELEPAAIVRPSGERAIVPTAYPLMPRNSRRADKSHSLIVRSPAVGSQETSVGREGDRVDLMRKPAEGEDWAAVCRHVPKFDRPVFAC